MDMTYFEQCFGFTSYTPLLYGGNKAIHPTTIKKTFKKLEGTKEADVLVSLVREITLARQRYDRLHEAYMRDIS